MQIALPGIKGSGELWLEIMKIICGDTSDKSMVDLGCHRAPYTPLLGFKDKVYVDILDRPLDHKEEQQFFVLSDATEFLISQKNNFDVIICSDMIEHLTIGDGCGLVEWMQIYSDKQIIFTPLGEYMVDIAESNNPDIHRSGWTPEVLPAYLSIIFPDFHPTLGIGAFFAVNCSDEEKQRISNEIKSKYVKDSAY